MVGAGEVWRPGPFPLQEIERPIGNGTGKVTRG